MRKPSLAQHLGIKEQGDLSKVFTGADPIDAHLTTIEDPEHNIGANLRG